MTITELNSKIANVMIHYPLGQLKNTKKLRQNITEHLRKETKVKFEDYTSKKIKKANHMFFMGIDPDNNHMQSLVVNMHKE
jgi:hypothetical protein